MAKKAKLYVGDKEVLKIQWNVVIYVDWSEEELTEKQLTYMVTKEPQDPTQMRDLMLKNVVPEVMDVLEAHNTRNGDFVAIVETIKASFDHTFQVAVWKAFWTYREWVHADYFQDDIRVSDLKRVSNQ